MKNQRKLKVLHVTSEYPQVHMDGGLGAHMEELLPSISDHSDCMVLVNSFFNPNDDIKIFDVGGITIIQQGVVTLSETRGISKRVAKVTDRIIAILNDLEFRPDIIHSHDVLNFIIAEQICNNTEARLISTVHSFALTHLIGSPEIVKNHIELIEPKGDTDSCQNGRFDNSEESERINFFYDAEKRMLEFSSVLIFVSKSMMTSAENMYPAYEFSNKSIAIYNGIDLASVSRLEITADKNVSEDLKIVFLGRLSVQKGLVFLLKAFFLLRQENKNIHLHIIGHTKSDFLTKLSGVYPEIINFDFRRVTFHGSVDRSRAFEILRQCDIGVVPSLWEPFGYVAVEIMLCGLPIVVSEIDGLAEIVSSEVDGLMVKVTKNPVSGRRVICEHALASTIQKYISSPDFRKEMSQAALPNIKAKFSKKRMVSETLEVYKNTVVMPPFFIPNA